MEKGYSNLRRRNVKSTTPTLSERRLDRLGKKKSYHARCGETNKDPNEQGHAQGATIPIGGERSECDLKHG